MQYLSGMIGVIVGFLLMGIIVWFTLPSLMVNKRRVNHNYEDTLKILSDSVPTKKDWIVLHTKDYQESTAAFASIERVCSMSVCNPRYASEILVDDANRSVTAFMPLALGIYEDKKGNVFVSKLNVALLGLMFGGVIAQVMKKAGTDLNEIIASVTTDKAS